MASAPHAVLFSSGLDSAVLAAAEARTCQVHPVYVSAGLAWEREELAAVDRLLASPVYRGLAPVARLTFTVEDLYPPTHWALRGTPPAFDTPDEDVYLTGRNIVLLSKAGIYCAQQKLSRIAIGPLAGNPFPDATPEFFGTMARALSLGLAHEIAIDAPFVDDAQERRDSPGCGAGRAVRADAVMHEPAAGTALRTVQQVPRAARRVSRGGNRPIPPSYASASAAVTQREILIEPSPLRSRSVRPPFPIASAQRSRFSSFSSFVGSLGRRRHRGVDAAIAGVRIDLGIEIRRQTNA